MLARVRLAVVLSFVVTAATACSAATRSISDALGAPDDIQKIRLQRSGWVQAAAERDAAGMMRFYDDTAVAVRTGSERIAGKPAILATWSRLLTQTSVSMVSQHIEVAAPGDVAYEVAAYELWVPGVQAVARERGQELVIWHRSPDGWRIAQETVISRSAPSPAGAAPSDRRRSEIRLASLTE